MPLSERKRRARVAELKRKEEAKEGRVPLTQQFYDE